jgi:hypothetical protein
MPDIVGWFVGRMSKHDNKWHNNSPKLLLIIILRAKFTNMPLAE